MRYHGNPAGFLYIILGLALFFIVAGALVVRFLLALFALALINYGLRLQGGPPTHVILYSWLDRFNS